MRVISKTIGALSVAVGADEPLAWAPMPKGATLHSVTGEIHIIGFENRSIAQFAAYGFSGYMVPVIDPDAAATLKVTWDTMVVKVQEPNSAAATETIDYEWVTADTGEVVQPGEMNIARMTNLGNERQREIFHPRIEFLSFAKGPQAGFVAGTPDAWAPTDFKTFKSTRKLISKEPSYAMLTVTNPSLGDVTTAISTIAGAGQWARHMHLKEIVSDFWKAQAGMLEAGAESPYAEAVNSIQTLVAPDMLDESATLFDDANPITAMIVATWDIDYPDNATPKVLRG